ncbi:PREDICTED: ribonuclease Oy [Polistes dominula]|uniref:Ribonuclease Oy n=1 Tax=Polistes dominula TaxID=743375 RepID=A0ABM1HZV8_POLDO|nr:PREDICTED: ribonuclease Oy [Polistes dominula]XP_015173496.1 PREDICTED: ribonuclease Oy [Polistes dominula]
MLRQYIVTCLLLLLLFDPSFGRRRSKCQNKEKDSHNFDVLIFTQHWPQTVCYVWKEKSESHACALPKNDEWSIHGIWPTKYHTVGPNFCNQSLPFNASALDPIKSELEEKWIDVENMNDTYSFWRHEWIKHGTCAAILPELNTEFKYFQKGLELLNIYDMKDVLGKCNILPGSSYAVQDIFNAIKKIVGTTPEIGCVHNKEKDEAYIFEIKICFDKNLRLVDCDGISGYPSETCKNYKQVTYPGIVPSYYNVIQI